MGFGSTREKPQGLDTPENAVQPEEAGWVAEQCLMDELPVSQWGGGDESQMK